MVVVDTDDHFITDIWFAYYFRPEFGYRPVYLYSVLTEEDLLSYSDPIADITAFNQLANNK